MFGLFKKKDPICGMKEEEGKGIREQGMWFCSDQCRKEHAARRAYADKQQKQKKGKGCCMLP